jgi:hypothetical protein
MAYGGPDRRKILPGAHRGRMVWAQAGLADGQGALVQAAATFFHLP